MEITLPETAEQAVAKGAEALDRIRPGWATEVDPALLSTHSATYCIISQLWKTSYIEVERDVAVMIDDSTQDASDTELAVFMMAHGFYRNAGATWLYAELDHAWRAEIQQRANAPLAEVI